MTAGTALVRTLLELLPRERIVASDVDAGIALLADAAPVNATPGAWREAVGAALAAGYIHDPVTLPPGALQCHWRLELTPRGFATLSPPPPPASRG